MQQIHNQATAFNVEMGIGLFTNDIIDLLIKTGVKKDSELISKIKSLKNYQYGASETS